MTHPHNRPTSIDLEDTSDCPTADACEVCGGGDLLGPVAASCQLGMLCLTLCVSCLEDGLVASLGVIETAHRVAAHCDHLGIDLDQMADAMAKPAKDAV